MKSRSSWLESRRGYFLVFALFQNCSTVFSKKVSFDQRIFLLLFETFLVWKKTFCEPKGSPIGFLGIMRLLEDQCCISIIRLFTPSTIVWNCNFDENSHYKFLFAHLKRFTLFEPCVAPIWAVPDFVWFSCVWQLIVVKRKIL